MIRALTIATLLSSALLLGPVAAAPDPPATAKPVAGAPAPAPKPAPTAPTALSENASAPARLASPAPVPFVMPASTGKLELAAGASQARVEAKVASGKPTGILFTAPGGNRMFWIGVSSPKGDVWMAAYEMQTKKWVIGTDPKTHVSRLSVSFEKPTELLLVAITDSPETPFRFEVSLGTFGL